MDKSYLSDVLAFAPKDQYERNQQAGTSSSFGCFGRGDPFGNPINTVCQGVDVARCVVTLVPSSSLLSSSLLSSSLSSSFVIVP
jgi:hypothetical protein